MGNPVDEDEVEPVFDDFQFEFLDTPNRFNIPTRPGIDTTNRDGETRHIRQWVNRTITTQPVDYTINTTLRNPLEGNPEDVRDIE